MGSLDSLIKAPAGTKSWILNLGYLEADDAWFKRGANISTKSNPNPQSQRRELITYSVLIQHPKEGLILWETGCGPDYPDTVGAPVNDIFAQINTEPKHDLKAQIESTGNKVEDVKKVIMGHLHLDHAGGLKLFQGKGVPIIVHELELKNAFYSVATQTDLGVYLPFYLTFDLKWEAWRGDRFEVAQGVTLHHKPGHTPGLCILQLNMEQSGTWIYTSDHFLVKENWEDGTPQGFLTRDHDAWVASTQQIKELVKRTDAKIIFGHDVETISKYQFAPNSYT